MELLTDTGTINIDIHEIIMDIDDIMHDKITDETGITVSHRDIQKFIVGVIINNNTKQRKARQQRKELAADIKKYDKMYKKKLEQGKTVEDLNGITNKIKYYIFNYALIRQIGCRSAGDTVRCDYCVYEYDSEDCKNIRKESGFLPLYDNKKFI